MQWMYYLKPVNLNESVEFFTNELLIYQVNPDLENV